MELWDVDVDHVEIMWVTKKTQETNQKVDKVLGLGLGLY